MGFCCLVRTFRAADFLIPIIRDSKLHRDKFGMTTMSYGAFCWLLAIGVVFAKICFGYMFYKESFPLCFLIRYRNCKEHNSLIFSYIYHKSPSLTQQQISQCPKMNQDDRHTNQSDNEWVASLLCSSIPYLVHMTVVVFRASNYGTMHGLQSVDTHILHYPYTADIDRLLISV